MKLFTSILLGTAAIAASFSTSPQGWEAGTLPSATTRIVAAAPRVTEDVPPDLDLCAEYLAAKRDTESTQAVDGIPPDLDLCAGYSTSLEPRQLIVPSMISSLTIPTNLYITHAHEVMPMGSDMPSDHHHLRSPSSQQPSAPTEQPSMSASISSISELISVSRPAPTTLKLVRRGWCDDKVDACVAKFLGLSRTECKKWLCNLYDCYFGVCGSWGRFED